MTRRLLASIGGAATLLGTCCLLALGMTTVIIYLLGMLVAVTFLDVVFLPLLTGGQETFIRLRRKWSRSWSDREG